MKSARVITDPGATRPLPSFTGSAVTFSAREWRTLLHNRFLQVFLFLALAAGSAATRLTPSLEAIPFILLQITLYLVPLFGVLIGLSSAHGELEEQAFLFSQPVSRFALVAGKAAALISSLSVVLLVAFIPALIFSPRTGTLLVLWAITVLLGSVFVSLGLAIGFTTRERSRGVIYALVAWLILLIGFDLIAYGAALIPFIQQHPLLWLAVLLTNPIDAARVTMLFRLEDIPFTVASDLPLVRFWMDHLLAWTFALGIAWVAALLVWSRRQTERREF